MSNAGTGSWGMTREELDLHIIDNIDRAISEGWIKVCYQPIVRGSNDRVCSEEALARWTEPDGLSLLPDDFIPPLEKSGQIDKLDLFMIESVIEGIQIRREAGLFVVPISVNLSREDYNDRDIVGEICRRIDEADIDRHLIQIEITESTLGSDFDFVKGQIDRLRELGFKVCMDDFGSGYSSLDFLQKTDVDALKLDVGFMREFDTNYKTRIIITQLVRLASALGIDTIAEGVETEEQVEFLKEAGCGKLQGFYYCSPIPVEEIIERNRKGIQIGFENPEEASYFETIGRISLFDLDDVSSEDTTALQKYFETLPVAILEYNGESVHIARCNKSYKNFMKEHLGIGDTSRWFDQAPKLHENHSAIFELFEQSRGLGHRYIFDERFEGDIGVTGFIRHSADNEVTGYSAFTIAILSQKDLAETAGVSFAHAARALSADYVNLYYVDIKTDDFIEYNPDPDHSNMSVERHGHDFFEASKRDAHYAIYHEDLGRFLGECRKENILRILDATGNFNLSYRLVIDGEPVYVNMKAVSVDRDHIVIGVNNVDAYMRHKEALERAREESITYARITALSGEYIAIYTVDPSNDDYIEYSATKEYEGLGLAKSGRSFFDETLRLADDTLYPEDLNAFRMVCTKENILRDIAQSGLFEFSYRLLIGSVPVYVSLKAAMVEEKDGPRIIVGVSNIDERVRRSQDYEDSLNEARELAMIDGLTGVKSKRAYLEVEARLNEEISSGLDPEFAIVMLDLNGLKAINDAHGHQTGDNYLKAGCKAICEVFDHSPVFRVGGDEFVAVVRGRDYEDLDKLVEKMRRHNTLCIESRGREAALGIYDIGSAADDHADAARKMTIEAGASDRDKARDIDYSAANAGQIYDFDPADVVIACGVSCFNKDSDMYVSDVFDRADLAMYENKKALKEQK